MTRTADRIAYLVVTEPGGQDGMDRDDKGGHIVLATFNREDAEKRKGLNSRFRIERRIVDEDDVRKALAKLDPLEFMLVQQRVFNNI